MAGLLLAAGTAIADPRGVTANPVIFVHGGAGSAGQFQSQAMRFSTNGYPDSHLAALEYDSTFGVESFEDVLAQPSWLRSGREGQNHDAVVVILRQAGFSREAALRGTTAALRGPTPREAVPFTAGRRSDRPRPGSAVAATATPRCPFDEVERALGAACRAAADAPGSDPWARFRAGCHAYLDACLDAAVQQIVLLDAPVVLGWREWRCIDALHGLGLIENGLRSMVEQGLIARPLAHLLLGAITEAGMMIAGSKDVAAARRTVGRSLDHLLEALRARGRGPDA